MINFHRTACVKSGMMADALVTAREIAALVGKLVGVDVRLELPIGGNPWRIRWTIQYADLNAMEAANATFMTNAEYNARLREIADYLISGASLDEVWNVL
jgi:hypothetical protein